MFKLESGGFYYAWQLRQAEQKDLVAKLTKPGATETEVQETYAAVIERDMLDGRYESDGNQ